MKKITLLLIMGSILFTSCIERKIKESFVDDFISSFEGKDIGCGLEITSIKLNPEDVSITNLYKISLDGIISIGNSNYKTERKFSITKHNAFSDIHLKGLIIGEETEESVSNRFIQKMCNKDLTFYEHNELIIFRLEEDGKLYFSSDNRSYYGKYHLSNIEQIDFEQQKNFFDLNCDELNNAINPSHSTFKGNIEFEWRSDGCDRGISGSFKTTNRGILLDGRVKNYDSGESRSFNEELIY